MESTEALQIGEFSDLPFLVKSDRLGTHIICMLRKGIFMTKLKIVILTLLAFSLLGEVLAQDCGDLDRDIVFAGLDWDSAQLHNAITRYILEEGFKCSTDDIPGSTVPMIQGLARGDIDVYMELWANNAPEIYYEALAEEKVVDLGHSSDALEGWFVPRYVIEGDAARGIEPMAPELKSVFDLPQYAEIFTDPEEPEKVVFITALLVGSVRESIIKS